MLLTVTTSVVEYSCLHSADNKEHDYTIIVALVEATGVRGPIPPGLDVVNLQLHSDEVNLQLHGSIHGPFSAVHLK